MFKIIGDWLQKEKTQYYPGIVSGSGSFNTIMVNSFRKVSKQIVAFSKLLNDIYVTKEALEDIRKCEIDDLGQTIDKATYNVK